MQLSAGTVVVALTFGVALPTAAQEGTAAIGFFMTVDDANVPALEEGIRRHNAWHQSQGDPWTWQVWAAVTGRQEYVYIGGDHMWADFDNPTVDLAKDAENWAETGGPHTDEVNTVMWQAIPWGSRPPDEMTPMAQVFEFKMNPGGQEGFEHVLRKFTAAAESTGWPGRYIWSEVVSGGEGTTHFVVVPMQNLGQLDLRGTEPPQVLIEAYGETEARAIFAMFDNSMTFLSSRIWALRPDLSLNLP